MESCDVSSTFHALSFLQLFWGYPVLNAHDQLTWAPLLLSIFCSRKQTLRVKLPETTRYRSLWFRVGYPVRGVATTEPQHWTWSTDGSLSLLSPLGLQDKLNKRDKEVTALTSQTEMLRAQVSGKFPCWRAGAGPSRASGVWSELALGQGAFLHSAWRRKWPGSVRLHQTSTLGL